MPDLLTPAPVNTTAVLDVLEPVDWSAPLNRGLLNWHLVLPHSMGGEQWRNLVAPRHATLVGTEPRSDTLGWGPTRRQGGLGELRLNGTSSYGTVAAAVLYDFANTTFTVSCWVRATTDAHLIARRHSAVQAGGWFLRLDAAGTATARLIGASAVIAAQRSTVTTALLGGTWAHLICVFTTSTTVSATNDMTLYVNGRLDQGSRTTGSATYLVDPREISLGSVPPYASFLTGAMDDVRLYARRLSVTEVQQLYQASRTGYRRELRWLSPPQVWIVSAGTVRSLTAVLVGTSATPAALASLGHRLTASLVGTSTTPASSATLTRRLTSTLVGMSSTAAASSVLSRRVQAVLAGQSLTPSVSVVQQHRLMASLSAQSVTSTPTVQLPGQVILTASLMGQSSTPAAAPPVMQRHLAAHVQGASVTSASQARLTRRVTASLAGSSTTPAATAVVANLVAFTAQLQGTSSTPASAVTIARSLTTSLLAVSSTPESVATVLHQLQAMLTGVSTTADAVLLPASGLVLLQAHLQGTSQTSSAALTVMPTVRIGTVAPETRYGVVPAAASAGVRIGTVPADRSP